MSTSSSSQSQTLPAKEQSMYRKLMRHYEHKQFKMALRAAKQILSNPNCSDHGETLVMKGLILDSLGRQTEGMEIVKRGLRANLNSAVCWHIYGIVQRSARNFEDAMKAYKSALRIESDNVQVLRDLSLLQIQLRDMDGYRDSRHRILVARPTNRMGWIGYATACHLAKDYDTALSVIKEYKKNYQPTTQTEMYENSELILYEVMILRDAGRLQLALQHLEENAAIVFDRLAYAETRGELLMELGQFDKAKRVYWSLLDRNPNNTLYLNQIGKCKGIEPDDKVGMLSIYKKAMLKDAGSFLPHLFALFCLEGQAFEKAIFSYLAIFLRKAVPALFKTLYPLYSDETKVSVIESILVNFIRRVEEKGYNEASFDDDADIHETPSTILYIYYYLAQHFDYIKQYQKAHKYIDIAINHTPTLVELYLVKAKIHKHEGNITLAADLLVETQEFDTADRYINSKCVKYLLRAGRHEEAEKMCGKFTREGVSPNEILNEMQCLWYELECAKTFYNQGDLGEALRNCHQIERHFTEFYDDQYDFHSYCLRKVTLCSYVQMIRAENTIRNEKHYIEATKIALKIYLSLLTKTKKEEEEATPSLTAAEQRKQRRMANKAKAAEEKAQAAAAANQPKRRSEMEPDVVAIEPLDPKKLLETEDPMGEAAKFIGPLLNLSCTDVEVYLLGFDVYSHKNKFLLMIRCLKKVFDLDPKNPQLKQAFARFVQQQNETELKGVVNELVKELTDKFKALLD